MSRTFPCPGAVALIWLTFQRGRRCLVGPSAAVRIFGLAAALFSDLSESSVEAALAILQKKLLFQLDDRSAAHAGLACVGGMYRAVLSANENKSGSGETNIMIDLRKRN
jgi:hypothetical protein